MHPLMRVPHSLDSPGCGVQDDVLACLLLSGAMVRCVFEAGIQ
ncbi:hypothetical protein [Xylella fastidiosa]|nr:hypothetical protein [Xylella fastidiosa]MDG5826037.1 hypothetical protein [Xylella fastidiosa subsp. pauca]